MNNSIETILNRQGFYAGNVNGISMYPLLRHQTDVVLIRKITPEIRVKKYDVVLYRRTSNQLVLHRIIRIQKDGCFTMCGDGETIKENDVQPEQILGVMTEFYRGEKHWSCKNVLYKFYSRYWCFSFCIRKPQIAGIRMFRRIGRLFHGKR